MWSTFLKETMCATLQVQQIVSTCDYFGPE